MRFSRAFMPIFGLAISGLAILATEALAQGFGPTVLYGGPMGERTFSRPYLSSSAPSGFVPEVQRAPLVPKIKSVPAAKPNTPVTHERVVARNDRRPSIHPASVEMIASAAARYRGIAEAGDWPLLPKGIALQLGQSGAQVLALRARLIAEGDLAESEREKPEFDVDLAKAVKRFQARHGQSQTGLVHGPTLADLRITARERAHQLEESGKRLAERQFSFGPRYIAVNIPSASVEAIENAVVERRHIAVVGKADRASPEVDTRITNVNLNPTWTVPVSIIKKDIIPKMQKDPGYLAKAKIRIFGISGNEVNPAAIDWNTERATAFTLRQDSGSANALGQVRIDMPNRDSVYMHDTPSKRLFARDDRFHSSGCVRVENVRDLAAWLLEPNKGWDRPAIDAAIKGDGRKDIRLKEPVPVVWTYLTGYVTPDGVVHFRPDVYRKDRHEAAEPAIAQQGLPRTSAPLLNTSTAPARQAKAAPDQTPLMTGSVHPPKTAPSGAPKATIKQRIDP